MWPLFSLLNLLSVASPLIKNAEISSFSTVGWLTMLTIDKFGINVYIESPLHFKPKSLPEGICFKFTSW